MEKEKGKVSKFFTGVWEYFLVNILDLKGRLDTGRIGQIIGMVSLTAMSTWATWKLLVYKEAVGGLSPERLKLFSIVAAFPLALASMKDFFQSGGTSYKPKTRLSEKGFWGFIKNNLLDEYGRMNVERIGQMFGLVNLAIITFYLQAALYLNFKIDVELASVLAADSSFPMLLYRVRDWMAKKNQVASVKPETKPEETPGIEEEG